MNRDLAAAKKDEASIKEAAQERHIAAKLVENEHTTSQKLSLKEQNLKRVKDQAKDHYDHFNNVKIKGGVFKRSVGRHSEGTVGRVDGNAGI